MNPIQIYKLATELYKAAQGVSLGLGQSGGGEPSTEEKYVDEKRLSGVKILAKELLPTVKSLSKSIKYNPDVADSPYVLQVLNQIVNGETIESVDLRLAVRDAQKYSGYTDEIVGLINQYAQSVGKKL